MSSSSKKIVRELQDIQKKIEAKEHYYTEDELDAIWWSGYPQDALDSAYDMYDKGYTAAIIYAIVTLYVLGQRMDSSILLVNVIGFAAIAAVLIYLTKKYEEQSWPSYSNNNY